MIFTFEKQTKKIKNCEVFNYVCTKVCSERIGITMKFACYKIKIILVEVKYSKYMEM